MTEFHSDVIKQSRDNRSLPEKIGDQKKSVCDVNHPGIKENKNEMSKEQ